MLTTLKIAISINRFNSFGDCLKTDLGVIRFKGYRCVNGKYRKVYSVAKSSKIHNGYGYGFRGLVKRAFKIG